MKEREKKLRNEKHAFGLEGFQWFLPEKYEKLF